MYGYIAYHIKDPIYVGIGQSKHRWAHVISGKSHNNFLNKYVTKHKDITFQHFSFLTRDEAKVWEISKIKEFGRRVLGEGTLLNITGGGDFTAEKGIKHYYNPKTLEILILRPWKDVPEGFILGNINLKTRQYYLDPTTNKYHSLLQGEVIPLGWIKRGYNRNRAYYYHPETKHTISIVPGSEPEGYIKGNASLTGRKWFHSLDKKHRIYCVSGTEPDGWIQGHNRPGDDRKRYVEPTTGFRKRFYSEEVPEGWIEEHWSEGRRWYFKDGQYKMFHIPPDGWELKSPNKGREGHSANKGRVWITNGTQAKRVFPDTIPEGWKLGKA